MPDRRPGAAQTNAAPPCRAAGNERARTGPQEAAFPAVSSRCCRHLSSSTFRYNHPTYLVAFFSPPLLTFSCISELTAGLAADSFEKSHKLKPIHERISTSHVLTQPKSSPVSLSSNSTVQTAEVHYAEYICVSISVSNAAVMFRIAAQEIPPSSSQHTSPTFPTFATCHIILLHTSQATTYYSNKNKTGLKS